MRLHLPRATQPETTSEPLLPLELRWDAPPPALRVALSRRQFLKAAGIVAGALALPLSGARRSYAFLRGHYFTRHEYETLEALCDRIIPPDGDPGGRALGAARYIARLLTAFDGPRPRIFAGGPFSRRNPFPNDETGTPTDIRPRNEFRHFLPLTRLQDLVWRAEVFGSAAVPELAAIDAQFGGPKKGLRQLYRESLAKVDEVSRAMAGAPFAELSPDEQDTIFRALDAGAFAPDPRRESHTFIDVLIQHTLEGCFAPPEYGGNRVRGGRPQGWEMIGLEGDSQPLGYSIFSRPLDDYRERADHPMSTTNPNELASDGVTVVPLPLTQDGQDIQDNITLATSPFASGIC
jgi:hypothetical protein